MLDFETEVGEPLGDLYELAHVHFENMRQLETEEEEEAEDGTLRPIDPSNDEWREREWLTAMIPVVEDLISAAPSLEADDLESLMQDQLDVRRGRQERYDEWESQDEVDDNDSAAYRDQGSHFDIAEFFADL
jgi:hypothetical protein